MSRVPAPTTLSYRDRSHLAAQNPYTDNSRTSVSPAPSGRTTPSGLRYADDLEGQNDEALEGLTAKVKLLKDISIGIGNEVKESAIQLSHMNDAFAETGGILAGAFRRMNNMAARQGGRWMLYMLFLVLVGWIFFFVWVFR